MGKELKKGDWEGLSMAEGLETARSPASSAYYRQEQRLWLVKGVGGLLCVGFGLSLLGEALIQKLQSGPWFWWGTASLVVFNFGLCLMFDSHNHQIRMMGNGAGR